MRMAWRQAARLREKKEVTFFEKKVTKKTLGPAGVLSGIAFNRLRWRRLKAMPGTSPPDQMVFARFSSKKRCFLLTSSA
jgi:hypothetical protein